MSDDDARIDERAAGLLPEEEAAGSDDPHTQAEAILAESDERQANPEPDEQRTSEDVTDTPP